MDVFDNRQRLQQATGDHIPEKFGQQERGASLTCLFFVATQNRLPTPLYGLKPYPSHSSVL